MSASWKEEYRSKCITADEAAARVKSNDIVDFYAFTGVSRYVDAALAKRVGQMENVCIRSELRIAPPLATLMSDPEGKTFWLDSLFRGPFEAAMPPSRSTCTPARLNCFQALFENGDIRSDVCAIQVSPPDNEGYMHFSPSPSLARVDALTAKCFCAEINENLFPLRGTPDCRIHVSEVTCIVEGDSPPITEVPSPPPTEVDKAIAGHVMSELCDGACLQVGYGAVPDAVAALIAHSDIKDLGVHTEFMGDGLMHLYNAGKITGARKNIDRGKIVSGIAFGSRELYDFVRDCPDIWMVSTAYSNLPQVIAQNDHFIAVNAFLSIDFAGQVNAESIGTKTLSGTGGQLDFILGTQLSHTGKAILCAPSTYVLKDGTIGSRIVATLAPGATVTSPRSVVQYIATEFGIVNLRGRNLWERAELLISIAHPDFRDALIKEAEHIGVWRRSHRHE